MISECSGCLRSSGHGDGHAIEREHVAHSGLDGAESCNEGVGSCFLGGLMRGPADQPPPASMGKITKRRNLTPPMGIAYIAISLSQILPGPSDPFL